MIPKLGKNHSSPRLPWPATKPALPAFQEAGRKDAAACYSIVANPDITMPQLRPKMPRDPRDPPKNKSVAHSPSQYFGVLITSAGIFPKPKQETSITLVTTKCCPTNLELGPRLSLKPNTPSFVSVSGVECGTRQLPGWFTNELVLS